MSTFVSLIQRGLRADQPVASTVPAATLYYVTDETALERSTGSAWESYSATTGSSGALVQVVNTETGAVASGTTVIPFDDTIPQQTEGDEYLTLAITPTSAVNILQIDVMVFLSSTNTPWLVAALFQDSTANALGVGATFNSLSTAGAMVGFRYTMLAGTVSATTFKVRCGPSSSATMTFNGQSGVRIFGGAFSSSMTISEIIP